MDIHPDYHSNTPWYQWILEEIIIISWGITVVIIIFLWIFLLMNISTGVIFFFASVDTGSHTQTKSHGDDPIFHGGNILKPHKGLSEHPLKSIDHHFLSTFFLDFLRSIR